MDMAAAAGPDEEYLAVRCRLDLIAPGFVILYAFAAALAVATLLYSLVLKRGNRKARAKLFRAQNALQREAESGLQRRGLPPEEGGSGEKVLKKVNSSGLKTRVAVQAEEVDATGAVPKGPGQMARLVLLCYGPKFWPYTGGFYWFTDSLFGLGFQQTADAAVQRWASLNRLEGRAGRTVSLPSGHSFEGTDGEQLRGVQKGMEILLVDSLNLKALFLVFFFPVLVLWVWYLKKRKGLQLWFREEVPLAKAAFVAMEAWILEIPVHVWKKKGYLDEITDMILALEMEEEDADAGVLVDVEKNGVADATRKLWGQFDEDGEQARRVTPDVGARENEWGMIDASPSLRSQQQPAHSTLLWSSDSDTGSSVAHRNELRGYDSNDDGTSFFPSPFRNRHYRVFDGRVLALQGRSRGRLLFKSRYLYRQAHHLLLSVLSKMAMPLPAQKKRTPIPAAPRDQTRASEIIVFSREVIETCWVVRRKAPLPPWCSKKNLVNLRRWAATAGEKKKSVDLALKSAPSSATETVACVEEVTVQRSADGTGNITFTGGEFKMSCTPTSRSMTSFAT
eukprot:g4483.t1